MLRCQKLSLASILLCACPLGCATWTTPSVPELPLARIPHDSVVLEAAFVRMEHDTDLSEVWRHVDEQQLAAARRRNLAANGIRSGVVGVQIPSALQTLLDSQQQEQQLTSGDSFLASRMTAVQQQITMRAGERSELVVVPQMGSPTVVLMNDEEDIRATRFQRGQALFEIRAHPAGDGTVRLELTPEIKHGQLKQQYVPGNGTLLYDVGREVHSFDQLRFDMVLSPGETLLITATDQAKGLGAVLFSRESDESPGRLLLLLRLSQTQYDDLFATEPTRKPLASPLD